MTLEELKAENARLKAELAYDKRVQLHVDKLAAEFTQSEVECLKAEVERLRASSFVTAVPVEQYERVIKHGDAMAEALEAAGFNSARDFWNAAKEGKQP